MAKQSKDKNKDMKIICADCENPFVFSEGEQRYYQQRGLYPPRRCPVCRMNRKNGQSKS